MVSLAWSCRKDSLLTHRAFCDALAEESARLLAAAANNGSTITTTTSSSNNNDLLNASNNITPLFLPFASSPPPVVAAAQNPNNTLFFLRQELSPFLQPRVTMQQQPSPYLDLHMHVDASIVTTTGGLADGTPVSFGLALDGSVATVGHRRLTRDFLGVDGGGRQVEELQLPLCATAAAAGASRTASCATDLTRQCLGGRLPPVNETWSHNF